MNYLGVSKVANGNKVTILKDANKYLHIKPGDLIAFYEHNEEIILKKVDI